MKPFRERNTIMVGLVSVAVLTVGMLFAFSLDRLTSLRGVYILHADFADAAGLMPENEVRVAGLRVGKVRAIGLAGPEEGAAATGLQAQHPGRFDRVRVTMEVERRVNLGNASTAEIKLKTLLGAKFVDVSPRGGAPLLGPEDIIPLERTVIPFEIYQATNVTVDKLGQIDAAALNDALRALAAVTHDPDGNFGRAFEGLSRATGALAERDADLESLLRSADAVVGVLASRADELGRIMDSSARLLGALSERREALRTFVRATDRVSGQLTDFLRSTRSDLDPALRHLHEVLEVASANLVPLEQAVEALGPSSESFARAFTKGTWGDVWLATALGLPLPPGCELSNPVSCLEGLVGAGASLSSIFEEAVR